MLTASLFPDFFRAILPSKPPVKRPVAGKAAASPLETIFMQEYRELRPRAPMPEWNIKFRRFVSLNTTIRLKDGMLTVRLSDILETAPESVHRAIAHILIAKLYRKPISAAHNDRYRRWTRSDAVSKQTEQVRQQRGRKKILSAQGRFYDLDAIFDAMNLQFFGGLLGKPVLTWSAVHAKRLLGHYDAAHNTIMVSKALDQARVPLFVVEYLMYHEMLHLKHPVTVKNGRRCVHSRAFVADEKLFPQFEEAKRFLRTL